MAQGPGKYDDLCTQVREQAKADGAVLMILGGEYGNGFSVQADFLAMLQLPSVLRMMADQIEKDTKGI